MTMNYSHIIQKSVYTNNDISSKKNQYASLETSQTLETQVQRLLKRTWSNGGVCSDNLRNAYNWH